MSLEDMLLVLRRRWLLALVGLLVSFGAAAAVFLHAGATYKASGTMVLIPPKSTVAQQAKTDNMPTTPLLYLGNLVDARDLVVANMSSKDITDQVEKDYPNSTVSVAGDPGSNSPLILISVSDPDSATAIKALQDVQGIVPNTLKTMQDKLDIPDENRITVLKLTSDSAATPSRKKQIEYTGLTLVALLGLTLILVGLIDGWRRRAAEARLDDADEAGTGASAVRAARATTPVGNGVQE